MTPWTIGHQEAPLFRLPGRFGAIGCLFARLGAQLRRRSGQMIRSGAATDEAIVARHGPVEIRRTRPGWSVETRVKGEHAQARKTALQRLSSYPGVENGSAMRLRAAWPLVQQEEAPRRWLVRVALAATEDACAAASPRNGKVRIRAVEPEILAVLRMFGTPTPAAIARGDAVIRAALADTTWQARDRPMIRLHKSPPILPFTSRFEVVLPVTCR
jgi:hypothetical protein